jgi:hypothetical protein
LTNSQDDSRELERNETIEVALLKRLVLVGLPVYGHGISKDGNTRQFFEKPKATSELNGVDKEILRSVTRVQHRMSQIAPPASPNLTTYSHCSFKVGSMRSICIQNKLSHLMFIDRCIVI